MWYNYQIFINKEGKIYGLIFLANTNTKFRQTTQILQLIKHGDDMTMVHKYSDLNIKFIDYIPMLKFS